MKPWISLSGDDDGKHYLLYPQSEDKEDWNYDIETIIDTGDFFSNVLFATTAYSFLVCYVLPKFRDLIKINQALRNNFDACFVNIILRLSVAQQNMRVTRQIVLPFLKRALYEFGCFKGILQKDKLALLLFYRVALTRFCMIFGFLDPLK